MKLLLALIFLAGIYTALTPIFNKAKAVGLWSDFKAYQSRAMSDPAGQRILEYGGENEKDNFEVLLDGLFHLNDSKLASILGVSISVLAAIGMILDRNKPCKGKLVAEQDGAPHPLLDE